MKLTVRKAHRTVVVAGLACLAAVGATVVAAPSALAQSGRRVCEYGQVNQRYDNNGKPAFKQIWAINYKEKGDCPTITNQNAMSSGAPSGSSVKVTCEEFGTLVGSGYDPCVSRMDQDEVYHVNFAYTKPTPTPLVFFEYGKF
jgi:hypothetical protein